MEYGVDKGGHLSKFLVCAAAGMQFSRRMGRGRHGAGTMAFRSRQASMMMKSLGYTIRLTGGRGCEE